MTSGLIFARRFSAKLRAALIVSLGALFALPLAAQEVYRFYESGAIRELVLSSSEIAVKARSGASDASVTDALRRHIPDAVPRQKWDRSYLVSVSASQDVQTLTSDSAAIRTEPDIVDSAPVLYLADAASPVKGAASVEPNDARRLAAMRIVTARVIVNLSGLAAEASRIQKSTRALSAEPIGADGWWLFTYQTPQNALEAARWMSDTAKLESAPVFERLRFARTSSPKLSPNDALFPSQWHLNSSLYGINVQGAWDTRQGTGRHIAMVDDGLQLSHPDLAANTYSVASGNNYDFNGADTDPSPGISDYHGTLTSGLAAARGNNALGVAGVAFMSKILALRLIAGPSSDLDEQKAFTWKPLLTDVSSNSWGPFDDGSTLEGPGPLGLAGLQTAVTSGRGGRGVVFAWAGGNGGALEEDSNYDGYANSRYVIAVGASNDSGGAWGGSEPGANIAVVAPGVNLITTDRTGADGYDPADYTTTHGATGTSASTPLVAGAAALLIEANPNLGYRDIKEILMRSANRTSLAGGEPFEANGAGIQFSHAYGAGLLDVGSALSMAASWPNLPAETSVSSTQNVNLPIPDNDVSGLTRLFDMSGLQSLRVETVELTVNITHPYRGDLEFLITAPSGMQSRVRKRALDNNSNFANWTFRSVRHWGENSSGVWSVRVADLASEDTGTLTSLTLRIWGTPIVGGGAPDLTISSLSGPNAATVGGQITVGLAVTNQGTAAVGPFRVQFFFSETPNISTSSASTGWGCDFNGLGAGQSTTCGGPIDVPGSLHSGDWFLGAIADPSGLVPELNEANNSRVADSGVISVGGFPGGPDKVGVYDEGLWRLDTNGSGGFNQGVDRSFTFGWQGVTPITGDWNGNGRKKAGIYVNGFWYLDYDGNGVWDGGVNDKQYQFGWNGITPLVGDWDGDGRDSIGIYINGFWFLDANGDGLWDGPGTDIQAQFGWNGVTPFVGDWNGDGRDKIGFFINGFWYLDYNGNAVWNGPGVDRQAQFGWTGVTPLTGDWNGDGSDTIGIYINGFWYLDADGDGLWDGPGTDIQAQFGWNGVTPLIGDWNGDGRDKIGIFINGFWYLDADGSAVWDGGVNDKAYAFGQAGDTPFVGPW